MRYILITLFTLGISFNSYSQLKLSTMMNIIKMNIDQFEDYTLNNNWVFHKINNSKELNGICYVRKSINDKEFLTLYTKYFDEDRHLTYQLYNKNSYINLKNQIKLYGFKLQNTEIKNTSVKYNYWKKINNYLSYKISIYQIQPDLKNKIYGSWEINLSQILDMNEFNITLDTNWLN
jgi:hypothetical protein